MRQARQAILNDNWVEFKKEFYTKEANKLFFDRIKE